MFNNRLLFISLLFILSLGAKAQVQVAGGLSLNYAPYASYDNNSGSGMLASIFGDLIINDHFIARAHASRLLVNTFTGGTLNSSFAANGSLGYNAVFAEGKLEVPFMATLGYINIWYPVLNDDFYNASLQIGGMITPTYYLTEQLALITGIRYLKGTEAFGGAEIDLLDLSVGLRLRLF